MRILLMLIVAVHVGFVSAQETSLSPTEMRRMTGELLRAEATAASPEEKFESIVALCDMYVAIRLHPSYEQSETLRGEGAQVRRRLITANRKVTDKLERDQIPKPAGLAKRVDEALENKENDAPNDRESSATGAGTLTTGNALPTNVAESNVVKGGGGPGAVDESWALVELIQRTIRPDFWDVTGGPGTIRYFAMRRVLVVRATTQVHEELAALLRSL